MKTQPEGATAAEGPSQPYDCIVISDLHLGSDICQGWLLEDFLEWAAGHSRALVINGDIFDDLNFKRLKKSHFACLKSIRRNSDRSDFHVTWVRGNHDGPADVVGHIVGVEVLDEYIYDNGQARLLILHGDQFDEFVTDYGWPTELACRAFHLIQKWAPHGASRWVRQISKRWQRNSPLIQKRALAYAASKGIHYVTCGHTHVSLVAESGGVTYFNTGTWAEHPPCPFVSVRGAEVRLEHWPLPTLEVVPRESDQTPVIDRESERSVASAFAPAVS